MNLSARPVKGVQKPSRRLAMWTTNGAPLSSGPDGREPIYCWELNSCYGYDWHSPGLPTFLDWPREKIHFNPFVALLEPGLETIQEAK